MKFSRFVRFVRFVKFVRFDLGLIIDKVSQCIEIEQFINGWDLLLEDLKSGEGRVGGGGDVSKKLRIEEHLFTPITWKCDHNILYFKLIL